MRWISAYKKALKMAHLSSKLYAQSTKVAQLETTTKKNLEVLNYGG